MNILHALVQTRHALPRVLPLMRDARVPLWLKGAAVILALLIVSPFDLLSDIPILGFFDDVTLLAFLSSAFVRFAESSIARASSPATYEAEQPAAS